MAATPHATPALRRHAWALLAILAVAAAIRLAGAGGSLWFDEFASLHFARQPLSRLWSDWMVREPNPPLYYTLLHGWTLVAGTGDRAMRLLSVAIGLSAISAIYLLCRPIGGARAGLVAALFLALSPAHVEFSQQLRGYGLAHAGAAWAMVGMFAFARTPRAGPLMLYVAAMLVALHAHTTMLLCWAILGIAGLFLAMPGRSFRVRDADPGFDRSPERPGKPAHVRRWRAAICWVGANMVVALGWAWWTAITWRQMSDATRSFGWIPAPTLHDAAAAVAAAYVTGQGGLATAGAALGIVLLALVAWFGWRGADRQLRTLSALAVAGPALAFAVSLHTPILLPRTILWGSTPFLAALALLLCRLTRRPLRAAGVAAMVAFALLALGNRARTPPLETWPLALARARALDPAGPVLVVGDAMAIAAGHYARDAGARILVTHVAGDDFDRWADGQHRGPIIAPSRLCALLRARGRIVTLVRATHNPAPVLMHCGRVQRLPRHRPPYVDLWRPRAEPSTR